MRWLAAVLVLCGCGGAGDAPGSVGDAAEAGDLALRVDAAFVDAPAAADLVTESDLAVLPSPDLARFCQPTYPIGGGECGCAGMACCSSKTMRYCTGAPSFPGGIDATCFINGLQARCFLCGELGQDCCGTGDSAPLKERVCSGGLRCVRVRNSCTLAIQGCYACRPPCGRAGEPCCLLDPCEMGLRCLAGDGGAVCAP